MEFFKDIKVKNGTEGVHFKMQRDGRASGEAFVELETSDDRDASLALNGQYIGKRYIEVYDSSYPMMEREIGPLFRGEQGCVIRLRGLPYRSTEEDIRLFFKGEHMPRSSVLHGICVMHKIQNEICSDKMSKCFSLSELPRICTENGR